MNTPRIRSVSALDGARLLVIFADETQKVYDCRNVLTLERFQLLRNEAFFKAVRVDPGGCGISWNDRVDLSAYELWSNGIEVHDNAK